MDKQALIDSLNEALAYEYAAIIQYISYAAKTTGPYRPELSEYFLAEVVDEQGHAQYLANKIVALGGQPTTTPKPVPEASNNQEMLQAVLREERGAIERYKRQAKQADELGEVGLVVQLEDMIRDETEHAEETERMLRNWPE